MSALLYKHICVNQPRHSVTQKKAVQMQPERMGEKALDRELCPQPTALCSQKTTSSSRHMGGTLQCPESPRKSGQSVEPLFPAACPSLSLTSRTKGPGQQGGACGGWRAGRWGSSGRGREPAAILQGACDCPQGTPPPHLPPQSEARCPAYGAPPMAPRLWRLCSWAGCFRCHLHHCADSSLTSSPFCLPPSPIPGPSSSPLARGPPAQPPNRFHCAEKSIILISDLPQSLPTILSRH